MAKQRGIFKVQGTLDDVNFYRTKEGYMLREKGGVSAERMASDPAFARTRENQAEFGRAGKAGKLLRQAFRTLLKSAPDDRLVSRLLKEMMRVVKADATSTRGQRNVLDGELELLTNFDFNQNGKLGQTLYAPYTASIDRASGNMEIQVPALVPDSELSAPAEATHYQIIGAAADINFEAEEFKTVSDQTGMMPLGSQASAPVAMALQLDANSTHPLFLVLGIAFYQEVNGQHYPLKNGSYNAVSLVKVSGV